MTDTYNPHHTLAITSETIHTYIQPYTPNTSPLHERDDQTAATECFMKICGASRSDHRFSFFIDDQIVPHHALGKIAVKGCDLGCQRANHSRAIRGAAVPCGESLGVFSEDGGFRWCTTAAHNQARRLAWLAGSFGNSRRPRLPGGGLSAPNSGHGIVVAPCTTSLLSGRYARFWPFSFITSLFFGRCARSSALSALYFDSLHL